MTFLPYPMNFPDEAPNFHIHSLVLFAAAIIIGLSNAVILGTGADASISIGGALVWSGIIGIVSTKDKRYERLFCCAIIGGSLM